MRDPERLENFYEELKHIHQRSFPDWRFTQLFINFINWLVTKKKTDGFYYEEDKTLEKLKEFEEYYRG